MHMSKLCKLLVALGAVIAALPGAAGAQTRAGDNDDQFVVTGCVTPSRDVRIGTGPHSLFVWSRGDVYLASPDAKFKPAEPVGTTGTFVPVFYWIDDENDFEKYVGQRVEVVGEMSDRLRQGELEMTHDNGFTELEFEVGGREATARVPRAWFGPALREGATEIEADVTVRTVDVETVTPLGPCPTR
jgi:hypothetical protein